MRIRIADEAGHFRSWEVTDQTNLFVEVVHEGSAPTYVGSLYFDEYPDRWDISWGTADTEDSWWNSFDTVTVRKHRLNLKDRGPMTEIIVHAWHVFESSGGFDWCPISDAVGAQRIVRDYEVSAWRNGSTAAALATLKVAGYAPDEAGRARITELIEGELQDAIEVGRVGHIISRFNNEPLEGSAS